MRPQELKHRIWKIWCSWVHLLWVWEHFWLCFSMIGTVLLQLLLPPPFPPCDTCVCVSEREKEREKSVWIWWHHAADWESMLFMGVHILIERQAFPLIIIRCISLSRLCPRASLFPLPPSSISLPLYLVLFLHFFTVHTIPHPHFLSYCSSFLFPLILWFVNNFLPLYHSPPAIHSCLSSTPTSQSITQVVNSRFIGHDIMFQLTLHHHH